MKEKDAEIEVLKEMVKSSNIQAKAKETDLQRLIKKLERYEKGSYKSRDRDTNSSTSRQSRKPNNKITESIPERDEMLEQTGGDYLYQQQQMQQQSLNMRNAGLPKMTKTRQQEWEEAVELDRMLEEERKQ